MKTSIARNLGIVTLFVICILLPLATIYILDTVGKDLVDSCVIGFFVMMILGVFVTYFWSHYFDKFGFGMCVIIFALQCLILYFTMDSLDNSLWVIVATQAGAVIGSGAIPIFIGIIDVDFDF